jgi:hypothetical protein
MKFWKILQVGDRQLASQEGLSSIELFNWLVIIKWEILFVDVKGDEIFYIILMCYDFV